jgi:Glycosyl hydrolase catalytic core
MQEFKPFDPSDVESSNSSISFSNPPDLSKSADGRGRCMSLSRWQRSQVAIAVLVATTLSGVSVAIGISLKHKSRHNVPQSNAANSTEGHTFNNITSNTTSADTEESTNQTQRTAPSHSPTPKHQEPSMAPTSTPTPDRVSPSWSPSTSPSSGTGCTSYADGLMSSPLAGKRGIAFTMRESGEEGSYVENLPKLRALEPYWFYSWASSVPDQVRLEADGIEFVPMIWGAWSSNGLASTLDQIANDTRVQRVLGFNEPDQTKQSNMNASVALRYWEQIESALPHVPLISPACAAPDGEWMQDFMSGLQQTRQRRASDGGDCPPRVDTEHVAVHWYGPANVETFQEKIRLFHDLYNKSLMITEFAVADWDATSVQDNQYSRYDVLEFMKAVVPWLESQSWIAAYAWFPFNVTDPVGTSSALFDRNGNLTRLGMYYKSVVNDNQAGNQSIVAWTGSR